jgi:hypothetical protein
MNCGLMFWRNCSHNANIFKVQNNIIRVITGCRSRGLCGDLIKNLKVVPLQSQYMLSLLLFVLNNESKFKLNSDVYNMNTKQKYGFHQPSSDLLLYQKRVDSVGLKHLTVSHKVSKM